MNFFRSEEHLRNWDGFMEKNTGGIISLDDLMKLFSGSYFKNRRDPDYFLKMGEYFGDTITTLSTLENAGSFWRMKWFEKFGFSLAVKLGMI
jgi:hypothetical protein